MRLRRTIAAALGLLLLVVLAVTVGISFGGGGDEPARASSAVDVAPPGAVTGAASTAPDATPGGDPGARATPSPTGPTPADASDVPEHGSGEVKLVAVPGPDSTAEGRVVHYTVAVEKDVPVRARAFARSVHDILLDRRGWQGVDHVRFVPVSPADATAGADVDVQVKLATPDTTDRLCAPFNTNGRVSCTTTTGTVVLNLRRWMLGARTWGDDVRGYRRYLVNHEVGHALGHGHVHCSGKGRRAPVMLQQTLGLEGCTPWSWPTGAKDGAPAPG
ncbi:MAG TPA: DUF3152 domain-containing protein [Segeticoccus sp.]|nr:DUF3152 domain-containing protein [Segeticoccus sp.]